MMFSSQTKTVLIIEPESSQRTLMQKLFENMGWSVHASSSQSESLKYLELNSPHLIITEVAFEHRGNREWIVDLKSSPKNRAIPVLVVSAVKDRNLIFSTIQAGATDYCLKPFRAAVLLQKAAKAAKAAHFRKKTFSDAEAPHGKVHIYGELQALSPSHFEIELPVKIIEPVEVQIHGTLAERDELKDSVLIAEASSSTPNSPGRFTSNIHALGLSQTLSRKLESEVSE
jgi:two-component system chemotaxis response regulator CheY